MKKFSIIAAIAALALGGCQKSYEIDMPDNPSLPVIGNEVSTNVVYQANPRFFAEDDCLKALQAELPRISDMGCDILWIMPVYEPGVLNGFGSPYAVKDFTKVNPKYGTLADLQALVKDAQSKGMKVLLDFVANHTAWDHAWIKDHPDWYVHDENGNIVAPSGWSDVAQLDFNNPDLCTAMKDAMLYWVKEVGIDGYRCDYADGVPDAFWKDLIAELQEVDPNIIMLAESSKTSFYADGFDMIYDWNSAPTISAAFNGGKPDEVVKEAREALAQVPDGKSILRYAFNHDVAAENEVDKMFGASEGTPAAYVLASMLNGTPMIYSSMDVEGLKGKLSFFDYKKLTFSSELTAKYKAINGAFKQSAEVRRGELKDYSKDKVVCFTREIPGHYLLVAVNTTGEEKTIKTPISLLGAPMTDLLTGEDTNAGVVIELEPYEYTILMN